MKLSDLRQKFTNISCYQHFCIGLKTFKFGIIELRVVGGLLILLSAQVQIYFIPLNPKVFPNSYQYWTSTIGFGLLGLTILQTNKTLQKQNLESVPLIKY